VPLKGKRGLIVGIANRNSIAFGCADVLRSAGANLAVTFLDPKAEPFVRPLAENLAAFLVSDAAAALTGNIEYVDAGYHILG
jgi:enoyl-[acyl-carrier protein] reductase I